MIPDMISNTETMHTIIVMTAFIALFGLAELLYIFFRPPIELTRKFVHISCGLIIASFHWIFISDWPVVLLGTGMILFIAIARTFKWFRSIYEIPRNSYGDFYYILAAVGLFLLSHDHPIYYFIAMLVLTISDALAALLGSTYQRVIYSVEDHYKSIEGSVVFFLSTFLIVHLPLLLLTSTDRLHSVLIAIQVSLIVTCLEAICLNGIDNLIVPLGTYFLLFKFMALTPERIVELLIWQFAFLALTYIFSAKFRFLTPSGAITFQLFLFGAFTLGDPTWLIPLVLAMGTLMIVITLFYHPPHTANLKVYQVVATFYISLIPAILIILHHLFAKYLEAPALLKSKNSFFALYVGAVSGQLAILLFRFFSLYSKKQNLNWHHLLILSLCSLAIILPFSLWIHLGDLVLSDILYACAVTLMSAFAYEGLRLWKVPTQFPWEFRLQALSTAIGTLTVMPFYILLIMG